MQRIYDLPDGTACWYEEGRQPKGAVERKPEPKPKPAPRKRPAKKS